MKIWLSNLNKNIVLLFTDLSYMSRSYILYKYKYIGPDPLKEVTRDARFKEEIIMK